MLLSGTKTNTPFVRACTNVSRQDGNLGNRERTGGTSLQLAPCPFLQARGLLDFYDHLGANIQPGVVGEGGRVAMTEMKRKPGPGNPWEHRGKKRLLSERERKQERDREDQRGRRSKIWKSIDAQPGLKDKKSKEEERDSKRRGILL